MTRHVSLYSRGAFWARKNCNPSPLWEWRKKTSTPLCWWKKKTYNPSLAKVRVNPHAKNKGQRSNSSNRRGWKLRQTDTRTDGWTDGQTLPIPLSPCFAKATRSIKIDMTLGQGQNPWAWGKMGKDQSCVSFGDKFINFPSVSFLSIALPCGFPS